MGGSETLFISISNYREHAEDTLRMDFRDAVLEFTVALPTLRRCEDNSANTYSEITARVKMVKDDSPSYL
jgi:hypothetical protein